MMKKVSWPAPATINGEICSPLVVFEKLVFNRSHVRDLENVSMTLDIIEKFESDPEPLLTQDECKMLTSGLLLQGDQIIPANFNRYVLRVIRALHFAESVSPAEKKS